MEEGSFYKVRYGIIYQGIKQVLWNLINLQLLLECLAGNHRASSVRPVRVHSCHQRTGVKFWLDAKAKTQKLEGNFMSLTLWSSVCSAQQPQWWCFVFLHIYILFMEFPCDSSGVPISPLTGYCYWLLYGERRYLEMFVSGIHLGLRKDNAPYWTIVLQKH